MTRVHFTSPQVGVYHGIPTIYNKPWDGYLGEFSTTEFFCHYIKNGECIQTSLTSPTQGRLSEIGNGQGWQVFGEGAQMDEIWRAQMGTS